MTSTPLLIGLGVAGVAGVAWWRARQRAAAQEESGSGGACESAARLAEQYGGPAAGAAARAACNSGLPGALWQAVKGGADALFTSGDERARENAQKNGARTVIPPALVKVLITMVQGSDGKMHWLSAVGPGTTLRYANGCVPYGGPAGSTCVAGTVSEATSIANTAGFVPAMKNAMSGRPAARPLQALADGTDPFTRRHPTRAEWDAEVARLRAAVGSYKASTLTPRPFVAFPLAIGGAQEGWWLRGVPAVGAKGSHVAIDHRTGALVLRPPSTVPPASGEHEPTPYTVDDQGRRDHRGLEDAA